MTRETCGRDHVDVLRSEVATLQKYISYHPTIMEYHEEHIARMAGAADELEALRAENAGLRKALVVKNQALTTFAECWNEHAIPTPEAFRRAAEAMKEVRDD